MNTFEAPIIFLLYFLFKDWFIYLKLRMAERGRDRNSSTCYSNIYNCQQESSRRQEPGTSPRSSMWVPGVHIPGPSSAALLGALESSWVWSRVYGTPVGAPMWDVGIPSCRLACYSTMPTLLIFKHTVQQSAPLRSFVDSLLVLTRQCSFWISSCQMIFTFNTVCFP